MSVIQNRTAVAPLRQHLSLRDDGQKILLSVASAVRNLRPEEPLHCLRPGTITQAAQAFTQSFPGDVLYAVKCNPEPAVLRAVWEGGVRHFDCASLAEIRLVRRMFPGAAIHFMHPVKSRAAIREAWLMHGVRDFVLDSQDELEKILAEIATVETSETPAQPGLIVRIALPKSDAAIDLSGKFGADFDNAVALLRRARTSTRLLGVAFHVGSQCNDPLSWREAMMLAGNIIKEAAVRLEVIDVGGGFPVAYPNSNPPPLGAFIAEIEGAFDRLNLAGVKLWAEPGRALVAGGGSLVVQVHARKGNMLYINDGVFGALSDAGSLNFKFPTRLLRSAPRLSETQEAFGFYGPTCDSADMMAGPFILPGDVREGDWIEIGQLGAYGGCLRTSFNGFDAATIIEVSDPAMLETAGYDPLTNLRSAA